MFFCKKYLLLLYLLFFVIAKGYAGVIDSLSTKQDIQKFLVANFGDKGIICLANCAEISRAEKEKIWHSRYPSHIDSIVTLDSVVHRIVKKVVEGNSNSDLTNSETRPYNYVYGDVAQIMEKYPYYFYKADIDGNGHTDLIIDAGIVIFVMDMGYKFQAYMLSDSPDWNSYSFKKFFTLSDSTQVLLLRHDRNTPKSVAHSYLHGKVTYVTNVSTPKTSSNYKRLDTLYKITTSFDTRQQQIHGSSSYKTVKRMYVDTTDMKLYNTTDSIVFKYGGFEYYKPGFVLNSISKIRYNYQSLGDVTGPINGCTALEITKDGKCFLGYKEYDAVFSGAVDYMTLMKLWEEISYIDIKSKKNIYRCKSSNGEGGAFTFYFEDGTVKTIAFWNYGPPVDIAYLSKELSDISKLVSWHRVEKANAQSCECVLPLVYENQQSGNNVEVVDCDE